MSLCSTKKGGVFMREHCNYFIVWLILIHFFCFSMEEKRLVHVTVANNENAFFQKSHIKQSLVLSVLYAHQKKHSPDAIIIPQASKSVDNIFAQDLCALRSLLNHQGDKFTLYMDTLRKCGRSMHVACAAYRLCAPQQLAQLINYLFPSDISAYIGSKMISDDLQEYMIKQIIKMRALHEPNDVPIANCAWSSNKSGAVYSFPMNIVPYGDDICFDGINPFPAAFPLKNKNDGFVKAISCQSNFYVTKLQEGDEDQITLWHVKDNETIKSSQKIVANEGQVTQVVFNSNETYLVMGSSSKKNNLFCWKLPSCGDQDCLYKLEGQDGPIGKIIINDEGSCIVSSSRDKTDVVVWDMARETVQQLYDKELYPITTMQFSRDGKQLWVCLGPIVSLWRKHKSGDFKLFNTMNLYEDDAIICRMWVDERLGRIVVGRTDGKLNTICMNTMREKFCLSGHKEKPINGIVGAGVGDIVISSTHDSKDNLMIWDISTGECLASLAGHPRISAILVTSDMRYIVSQSWQNVYLWQMYNESENRSLQYIKNQLNFLGCCELYHLYKMKKNNYEIKQAQAQRVLSLQIVDGVKRFIKQYLL